MTHKLDGCVRFETHPADGRVETLLEIDSAGRVTGDVVAGLRRWLDDTVGEPTCEVPSGVGDFALGVPCAERALTICADGRVLVHGDQVVSDVSIHRRFAAWFGASKVTLSDGTEARVRLVDPDAQSPNFSFCAGRGGLGKNARGGDVVLTAGAKRAQAASA